MIALIPRFFLEEFNSTNFSCINTCRRTADGKIILEEIKTIFEVGWVTRTSEYHDFDKRDPHACDPSQYFQELARPCEQKNSDGKTLL